MSFTKEQKELLGEMLSLSNVKQRQQANVNLSYLEGYHVINEANRIFGFDGWSMTVDNLKNMGVEEVTKNGRTRQKVGMLAQVTVTAGGVSRTDVGFGNDMRESGVDAYELACKEAVTDAMKRALRSFGNQFGNALYDKEQREVEDDTKSPPKKAKKSQKKTTEEEVDFLAMLEEIDTIEDLNLFRSNNRDAIKKHSKTKEIISKFNEKKAELTTTKEVA